MTDLQVGDVALDLAQGRPVHVVERYDGDAADWSDANNYELTDNYGNSRLGASEDDAVFEVVYCSSAKSEPTKTYAMPEARLLRIETEAADGGRPVRERIVRDTLETIFLAASDSGFGGDVDRLTAFAAGEFDSDLVEEIRELVDVEQTITAEDDND